MREGLISSVVVGCDATDTVLEAVGRSCTVWASYDGVSITVRRLDSRASDSS